MSRAQDRTARLMERFEPARESGGGEPPATPAAVAPTPARAAAASAKGRGQRRLASAEPPVLPQPAGAAPTALEPHTKRTFYVRTSHVDRLESEHRRLNYELDGVKLVEILDAVLDEGFKHFADVEARLRARG